MITSIRVSSSSLRVLAASSSLAAALLLSTVTFSSALTFLTTTHNKEHYHFPTAGGGGGGGGRIANLKRRIVGSSYSPSSQQPLMGFTIIEDDVMNHNNNIHDVDDLPHHDHESTPPPTTTEQELQQQQQQQQQQPMLLVGRTLKDEYILTDYIPVPSIKCELYQAYHKSDIIHRQNPLIVKLSHCIENIDIEYDNYCAIVQQQKLLTPQQQQYFVKIYDKIEPCPIMTNGMAGIVMESGQDNVRFYLQKQQDASSTFFQGVQLKNAMESILKAVNALHENGLVWSEIKAENFIVVQQSNNNGQNMIIIKGIDFESIIRHNDYLRMYTAESCPPEFIGLDNIHDPTYLPYKMQVDYSFDVWGVGMTLFELATGKPFYGDKGIRDLYYIQSMLQNPLALIAHRDFKLNSFVVDPQVRNIIRKCLELDPIKRSSCKELLQDPYFFCTSTTPDLTSTTTVDAFSSIVDECLIELDHIKARSTTCQELLLHQDPYLAPMVHHGKGRLLFV